MTTSSSPDRQLPLQHVVGAEAEHQRGPDGGGRVDREREERLPHRDVDARVDRALALLAEAAYSWSSRPNATITRSIEIASWMIDSDSPSMPLTSYEPLPDVRDVVADRVVEERDDRQRQQRQRRVDPDTRSRTCRPASGRSAPAAAPLITTLAGAPARELMA